MVYFRKNNTDNDTVYITAEENGEIVGSAVGGRDGHLDNIQVNKSHRRQGVGSELLKNFRAETGAVTGDFNPQGMSDRELKEFYKKNGYTVEGGKISKR